MERRESGGGKGEHIGAIAGAQEGVGGGHNSGAGRRHRRTGSPQQVFCGETLQHMLSRKTAWFSE